MALRVDQFTWHKKDKTLTAELSDLGNVELGNILTIEGHTKVLVFKHIYTDRDIEQDVRYWEYRNDESGFTVKIWND